MSRNNRVRITYAYPFRSQEKDAIIKAVAATYGVMIVEWHTVWYPAQPGDDRQVPVDHVVVAGSTVTGRVRITQFLLGPMRYHIVMHHEPLSSRMPEEVPPDREDTYIPEA